MKRALGNTNDEFKSEKKTKVDMDADLFEIRMLIKQSEVGPIIGTRGANIKRIRDEACVFASVVKEQNTGLTERILTVKGEVQNIAKGVWILCQILTEAAQQREDYKAKKRSAETGSASKADTVESYQVKFLCHQFQVGGVIGKAGVIIKQTKEQTGAVINVSNEPLGNSTDKSISVTGSADVIYNATLLIVQQLKDNPLKSGVRSVQYTPDASLAQQFSQAPRQQLFNPYGQQQQQQQQFQPQQQFGQPQQQQFQPQQQQQQAFGAQGAQETQSITIPRICASAVIGRGGSIINDIRSQSGTFISIAKPEASSPDKRVVAITGGQQQIQSAISMIRQIVENFEN